MDINLPLTEILLLFAQAVAQFCPWYVGSPRWTQKKSLDPGSHTPGRIQAIQGEKQPWHLPPPVEGWRISKSLSGKSLNINAYPIQYIVQRGSRVWSLMKISGGRMSGLETTSLINNNVINKTWSQHIDRLTYQDRVYPVISYMFREITPFSKPVMTDIANLSPEVDALDGFLSKIRWISDTHGIPMDMQNDIMLLPSQTCTKSKFSWMEWDSIFWDNVIHTQLLN